MKQFSQLKMGIAFAVIQLLSVSYSSAQTADSDVQKYMVEPAFEAPAGQLFYESDLTNSSSPISQYDTVIVINKSDSGPTAQSLRLYDHGRYILTTKVSTGRENVEVVKGLTKFFRKVFNAKGTTTSHWRHTTRGFYNMKRVESADYASAESGFHMPYAMFFNDVNGLAIHAVPPDLSAKAGGEAGGEAALGSRASSGCVRVHKNVVQDIYNTVVNAGRGLVPAINSRTGQAVLKDDGSVKMINSYRTLVIVEEI